MRADRAVYGRAGPFVLPARLLLLLSGLLAIGLALFNLYHEFHANQVDRVYAIVALGAALLWLAALIAAYAGFRLAVFVAATLAFVEFALVASRHFTVGATDIDTFWHAEGLPIATVEMALIPCCLLVAVSAGVCWSTPRTRTRSLAMLPVVVVALVGAVCILLQATNDLRLNDFGTTTPDNGTFGASVLAAAWVLGAFWIARVRRTGALMIAGSTALILYSFATLHLAKGGTSVDAIASKSGAFWAVIAVGAVLLAGASFLFSLGVLVLALIRPIRRPRTETAKPLRRGA